MKTKREALEEVAKNGTCANIKCNECPYDSIRCHDIFFRIGAMAILRMFKEKKKPLVANKEIKENIKNARKKLFNILTEYEIGNYDNNTHQFYEDVYDVHNELIELAE